jgi:hypothetical protein
MQPTLKDQIGNGAGGERIGAATFLSLAGWALLGEWLGSRVD